ncbi:hypothetical protein [Desulfobulbus oligotrophicus]|uniref:Uncharacterized protein n=1 Tax=Desulfobulbus oligotrophicus TaxID=1909699 RepID=A0A7T6APL8_9BACT|nr:hypothetical protein [Desulfobulbus oligotrophicus]QQG64793.1 hypothetical protein HP555_02405 [Desulfobulbus oligotrophicus]
MKKSDAHDSSSRNSTKPDPCKFGRFLPTGSSDHQLTTARLRINVNIT